MAGAFNFVRRKNAGQIIMTSGISGSSIQALAQTTDQREKKKGAARAPSPSIVPKLT